MAISFLTFTLYFEKMSHHIIVQSIVVPGSHESGKNGEEYAEKPTNIWEQVKDRVARPREFKSIQVRLECDHEPSVIRFLIWYYRLLNHFE